MPPKVTSTHTENIGIGGICVIVDEDLHIFRTVELELFLENGESPISCNGSIMWVVKKTGPKGKTAFDTGIEFVNLKEEDRTRLTSIVEEVLKKEGGGTGWK